MEQTGNHRARRETLAGKIVDGHELLRVLAGGGMGEVYLARHLRLGVHRAVKVIRATLRDDPEAAERFAREAHVLARLQHNSIVQIVESGEIDNGWPYLVMEYVDGPNLDEVIHTRGAMPLGEALIVLEQIANALAYAHDNGVVHRDLKPANVLLRGGDLRQVKVIDFGLARMLTVDAVTRLTAAGQLLGSPLYMAPEQATGSDDVTSAADSYALAAVAYTLISGTPVFELQSAIELVAAHATEPPPRLGGRCPNIPAVLDDMLAACLEKDPALRPTAAELALQLARVPRSATDSSTGRVVGADAHRATMPSYDEAPTDSELVRIVKQPPRDNGSGISDALVNQVIAVVSEIAVALAPREPELGRLYASIASDHAAITDLEMELVVLEARLEEVAAAERATIERQRTELAAQIERLRRQSHAAQVRLAAKVDELRHSADSTARQLYAEVDGVIAQLRSRAGGAL